MLDLCFVAGVPLPWFWFEFHVFDILAKLSAYIWWHRDGCKSGDDALSRESD